MRSLEMRGEDHVGAFPPLVLLQGGSGEVVEVVELVTGPAETPTAPGPVSAQVSVATSFGGRRVEREEFEDATARGSPAGDRDRYGSCVPFKSLWQGVFC